MLSNQSAHTWIVGAFEDENFHRIIVVYWRTLDLKDQYFTNIVLSWDLSFIAHVLLQLKIDKELSVCLAVYEVLGNDIIRLITKTLIWYCLYFQSKIERTEVFEWDWRHTDLIFLRWDFDHWSVFVGFVEVFNTKNLRNLAFSKDR